MTNLLSTDSEPLEVYFVRHVDVNGDWDSSDFPGVIDRLYEQRLITVIYDHIASWNPDDYSGAGISAIKRMARIRSLGERAYVIASYKNRSGVRILGGYPDTESPGNLDNYLGGIQNAKFKTIRLKNFREISYEDFPFAYALAPKFGTVVRWRQCGALVNSWLSNKKLDPLNPANYMPDAIELACEEYLRLMNKMSAKLFQTGRGLVDYDIVGVDPAGNTVYAQVKNVTSRGKAHYDLPTFEKLELKAKDDRDSKYYWFADRDCDSGPVMSISIQAVLKQLASSLGFPYLERLLNRS